MSSNLIEDQRRMMLAFRQKLGAFNMKGAELYQDLLTEEYLELEGAMSTLYVKALEAPGEPIEPEVLAEVIDGGIDVIVVTLGLLLNLGVDVQAAWDEVLDSNMAKVGRDGFCTLRHDGKILKPPGWRAPNLRAIAAEAVYPQAVL
jgi:predicted HAD superfamily Cof-like phosphohydrolase